VQVGPYTAGRDERPDESDGSEAIVLHVPVGDTDAAPGGFGHRRGPGERLQPSRVDESRSVIADFGKQTSTGEIAESDERRDDPVVGVLGEGRGRGLARPVDAGALSVDGG
jgi:hypothetical protein